ncbi:hypothetical protein BC936DRAFT_140211 [Jimgerdemannia flammicorona]|uniref:Cux N-terminal domain-containing protein n=1 Tax=Jimgerdemannia flammicorona TaxID=994334 RepID=A0A433AWI6_9FUNG|nr:hypothetical protein BC936DRAFT_140211 [Jimgerdemannia flammicorona]
MADTIDEGLATAIQLWKGINLSNLQRDLDQQGLEIVENQKDSLLSRKKLAEQTRGKQLRVSSAHCSTSLYTFLSPRYDAEFKKIPDEDKLQQFKTLLKGLSHRPSHLVLNHEIWQPHQPYQGEIDSITRRTKFAENAFLSLYKVLAEAPDPLPLFEVAVEQTSKLSELHSLQLDNERLREDLAEANRQAAQLRGSEANAAKLQQKLGKVEAKIEDMVDEQVAQKETEMKNLMDERIRNYKERHVLGAFDSYFPTHPHSLSEHELQRSLNQARDQLTMLQHTHDNTQAKLIDHSQKYGECRVGGGGPWRGD